MADTECQQMMRNGVICGYLPAAHTAGEQQSWRADPVHQFRPVARRVVHGQVSDEDLILTGWRPLGVPGQAIDRLLRSIMRCPVCRALVLDVDAGEHNRSHADG